MGLEKARYITLLFLWEKHILTRRLGTSWEPGHERDVITWLTGTLSSSCICLCWHHFWHIWKKEHNVCALLKSSTYKRIFGFFEENIIRVMTCLVFKIFYFRVHFQICNVSEEEVTPILSGSSSRGQGTPELKIVSVSVSAFTVSAFTVSAFTVSAFTGKAGWQNCVEEKHNPNVV